MYDELCKVKDLFTRFGGHRMAAGLSMPAGSADELRQRLNESCKLTDEDLTEKMLIDIPLPIGYVNDDFIRELERLEPFGVANPKPLFAQKDVPVRSITLTGKNNNVLKIILEGRDASGNSRLYDGVYFGDTEEMYERIRGKKTLSVLYQPGFSEYNGTRSIRLSIKDCR